MQHAASIAPGQSEVWTVAPDPTSLALSIVRRHLISQKFCGDLVVVEVLRKGQATRLEVPLGRPAQLVPVHNEGRDPRSVRAAGQPPRIGASLSFFF